MRIILLGSGNLATNLGRAFQRSGHEILGVWSRTLGHAKVLATSLETSATDQLSEIRPDADVYVLAVSDHAIPDVSAQFPFPDKILVHTSGTTQLNIPGIAGVFYPVQTFSREREVNFQNLPIIIEGRDKQIVKVLDSLARSISDSITVLTSKQRTYLHLAAVISCNFSNHLYALASDLLKVYDLSPELIKPLILETANKIQTLSPQAAQTGPAVRGDQVTMEMHLALLSQNPRLQHLYDVISQSIINLNEKA